LLRDKTEVNSEIPHQSRLTRNRLCNPESIQFYSLLLVAFSLIFISTCLSCATPSSQGDMTVSDVPSKTIKENLIALFPFENFSEDMNAQENIMSLIKTKLEDEGVQILDDSSLEKFLIKERIRITGYISKDMARKIRDELGVKAILVGSINSYNSSGNPQVGISARLVNSSDGSIIWANHDSATGEDFAGILGIGRITSIDKLAFRIVNQLLDSFTIVPSYKEKESMYTIAVMPFRNESKKKNAGMIATYMFITDLSKNMRFEPLEYGEVRRLLLKLRLRSKGELDLINVGSVSGDSGVDGILVGTVELYTEGEASSPPKAAISARLIDARKGRILWYDGYQYSGDEGITIFDWGRIRSAESVAYEVVSKLVKEMSKAKWH
jgi:TolB-like protein